MRRLALMAVLAAAGLWQTGPNQPAEPPKPPQPLKVAPLAYFTDHCQRCHGPEGAYYEDDFAKDQTDDQLREVLHRMADGPGGAPLVPADLDVQVAFHRALSEKRPFVAWTKAGDALGGETTADKLTATVAGQPVDVAVKDGAWTLKLPAGADLKDVEIRAGTPPNASVLRLKDHPYSVAAPKP